MPELSKNGIVMIYRMLHYRAAPEIVPYGV